MHFVGHGEVKSVASSIRCQKATVLCPNIIAVLLLVEWQEGHPACKNLAKSPKNSLEDLWGSQPNLEKLGKTSVKQKPKVVVAVAVAE